ncbi:MAG: LamG-like jellyroll fold domain-containing protein [Phycisphaerales bacterium]
MRTPLFAVVCVVALAPLASAQIIDENTAPDHDRHTVRHTAPHPASLDPERFFTNRETSINLPLPDEQDAFFFVVYGDRTGGPAAGINVLKDAVHDTNLLEPDLVMTVGDLVNGYNQTDEWMAQMTEFKGVMDQLLCPWFPVAGNHDVYWRGPGKPKNEHDADYEMHFGPLWYAFEHKNCWFIALYSDEGNPETGEKNFNKPDCQVMSDEQFDWLAETLERAKGADHVFLFLHHPRWLGGNYGDDWERVHKLLVDAGNVSAVFAGHIHRMRYDPRDGIEYVTLATVGGGQSHTVPDAGWLHQFHIVTVRKDQLALSSLPVGKVMDVRELTGDLADEAAKLAATMPTIDAPVELDANGGADTTVSVTIRNTTSHDAEYFVAPDSDDSRWSFLPDHTHTILAAGETRVVSFRVKRMANSLDDAIRPLSLVVDAEVLMPGHRYALPTRWVEAPIHFLAPPEPTTEADLALALDGETTFASIPSADIDLPDGPFTLECWFRADKYSPRTGLIAKTESSEYGLFVSNARPEFSVHLNNAYATAATKEPILQTDHWTHIAGVYDTKEVRLYVDGHLVARAPASGKRTRNALPLILGADVDGNGNPVSFFDGQIDAVRLSTTARYSGDAFTPARAWAPDAATLILHDMDRSIGPWILGPTASTARLAKGATLEPVAP